MKNLPHIISKVYEEAWLIVPSKHRALQRALEAYQAGVKADAGGECDPEEPEMAKDGHVAVIPVHGIIGKHLSMLETMCGGCDLDMVGAMIDEAVADSNVQRIIFDFRSPGGTVTGVPEMARKIGSIPKRTIAFTDSQCCSAAYWLASQCNEFHCTESSDIGSVGVYLALLDESRALDDAGIKINAISAGKLKLAGASFKPLTDEERAMFQAGVNKTYEQFKAAVRRNRELPDEILQGQCFDGQEAVENGMADSLVEDITELLDA